MVLPVGIAPTYRVLQTRTNLSQLKQQIGSSGVIRTHDLHRMKVPH
jgi:hypothetical protein